MAKFVVRQHGALLGGYEAKTEEEALDAMAKEKKHESFEAMKKAANVKRDHFTVEESK